MALEIPVDDVETENIGGYDKVSPGGYHMVITAVDEEGGKNGEMIVDCEIVRGTTPNMEGKEYREYFSKDFSKPLLRRKFLALGIATGLTTKAEIDKLKKEGKSPVLDFNQVAGRHICMNLEANTYQEKTTTRLAWDEIFHPLDKRASHIPLNKALLEKSGIKIPDSRHPDGILAAKGQAAKPASTGGKPASNNIAASIEDVLAGV